MISVENVKVALCLLVLIALGLVPALPAAEEEVDEAVIEMVGTLIQDEDRDMRALGLQQVRSEAPGAASTKKFAAMLPDLKPDAQAGLLEALGDRGDGAAKEAVIAMLKSEEEVVRAAALKALGPLGSKDDIALLSEKASDGGDAEKAAARDSLIRLQGDDINAALLGVMEKAKPAVRAGLLGVLAHRNAKESLGDVIKCAGDEDAAVRLAALEALRMLAEEKDTKKLVVVLKAAKGGPEMRKAGLAVLGVCSRGGAECAAPLIAGVKDASPEAKAVLVRAIARAGGEKSLKAVAECLDSDDKAVCAEAVRMLAGWPSRDAVPALTKLAEGDDAKYQVLAIRGLVRLAGPQGETPADVELLGKLMSMAKRVNEKQLVVARMGQIADAKALAAAMSKIDDAELGETAQWAAISIAGLIAESDKAAAKKALQEVSKKTKDKLARQRAEDLLKSL